MERFIYRSQFIVVTALSVNLISSGALGMCARAAAQSRRSAPTVIEHASARAVPKIAAAVEDYRNRVRTKIKQWTLDTTDPVLTAHFRRAEVFQAAIAEVMQTTSGKVLVMGNASAFDLAPLLEKFDEVHLVDFADNEIPYPSSPKLILHRADISGIDPKFQNASLTKMRPASAQIAKAEAVRNYLGECGNYLVPLDFESDQFDLVISLNVAQMLPYGPVIAALGDQDDQIFTAGSTGGAFRKILFHHRSEASRLLRAKGKLLMGFTTQGGTPLRVGNVFLNQIWMGNEFITLQEWYEFEGDYSVARLLSARLIGNGATPLQKQILFQK